MSISLLFDWRTSNQGHRRRTFIAKNESIIDEHSHTGSDSAIERYDSESRSSSILLEKMSFASTGNALSNTDLCIGRYESRDCARFVAAKYAGDDDVILGCSLAKTGCSLDHDGDDQTSE